MNDKKYNGSINLIIGCMFSGKTTELVRNIKRFQSIGKKTMVINYSLDDRYGDNCVKSHDSLGVSAFMIKNLGDIKNNPDLNTEYNNSEFIFINEGQFFEGLYDFCNNAANEDNKIIYVCGLDGDYKQKKFGELLDLIPISDSVNKLSALCKICGEKASFTKRNTSSDKKILIGNDNIYSAVCRHHYFT
ncbi:hypothetical protein CL656_00075 [bacterium]|nr:hypothetical protein [bacterium]|tara:strand:- start:4115 stop:4681 length:567 start_codon:yes stop_codon:yes gene_type:complete